MDVYAAPAWAANGPLAVCPYLTVEDSRNYTLSKNNIGGSSPMADHKETSTGSISKEQLITEMDGEQAAWLALLDEIGEANMTQPEVAGGWSIKDIVAHMAGWRRRTVRRFQAILKHEPDF